MSLVDRVLYLGDDTFGKDKPATIIFTLLIFLFVLAVCVSIFGPPVFLLFVGYTLADFPGAFLGVTIYIVAGAVVHSCLKKEAPWKGMKWDEANKYFVRKEWWEALAENIATTWMYTCLVGTAFVAYVVVGCLAGITYVVIAMVNLVFRLMIKFAKN